MDFKPPKASQVIKAIQDIIDKHGDLPMVLDDPDTNWLLPIGVEVQEDNEVNRIKITSCYSGEPSSFVGKYEYIDNKDD